ncbi:MAG: hypothetical protein ACXU82_09590 [Caulobacteraceae bacterium]
MADLDTSRLRHRDGFCWETETSPDDFPETDHEGDPRASCLILSEDGRDLGPGHSAIDMVAQKGHGLYSHWRNVLYLSASDNSDPTTNGRRYEVRRDAATYFRQTAAYSVGTLEEWARHVTGGIAGLAGRRILEVGPGRSMGTVAAMAALGGEVLAVDRFCGEWQEGWHEPFLTALLELMVERGWPVDRTRIEGMIRSRSFDGHGVIVETRPAEALVGAYSGFAGVSFSHSTFEHFYSVPEAAAVMADLCAPGAQGVHDVDFRDHANFGTPLEFLLLPEAEYARDEVNTFYSRGNRMRPSPMATAFRDAGFCEVHFQPYELADESYLDSFVARLAQADQSPFQATSRDDLSVLGGTFRIRR